MTKKLKKQWIEACERLLAHYEGKERIYRRCPLCSIPSGCHECLWAIFDGERWCNSYVWKKCEDHSVTAGTLRNNPTPEWRKDSIKRLDRWIKRLESE